MLGLEEIFAAVVAHLRQATVDPLRFQLVHQLRELDPALLLMVRANKLLRSLLGAERGGATRSDGVVELVVICRLLELAAPFGADDQPTQLRVLGDQVRVLALRLGGRNGCRDAGVVLGYRRGEGEILRVLVVELLIGRLEILLAQLVVLVGVELVRREEPGLSRHDPRGQEP